MITNDVKAYFENHPEYNIIPDDKVSIIKIKLAKSHRTEADWTAIKDILRSYNLIVCGLDAPDKEIKTTAKDGVLTSLIPPERLDIERECDITEEVGRLY